MNMAVSVKLGGEQHYLLLIATSHFHFVFLLIHYTSIHTKEKAISNHLVWKGLEEAAQKASRARIDQSCHRLIAAGVIFCYVLFQLDLGDSNQPYLFMIFGVVKHTLRVTATTQLLVK